MTRLLDTPQGRSELTARGMTADDRRPFGHAFHAQGSATYASSGSTACPSSTPIHLRAGWALGGVQDTYLRYESAGDMFVGKIVAGLPTTQAELRFCQLDSQSAMISSMAWFETAFQICYQAQKRCLLSPWPQSYIMSTCCFLERTLPPNHRLFHCPLFGIARRSMS